MNMTPRLQQLLTIMLAEDKIISVVALSERIKVSKRTVQRELEYLPKALRKYNLQFLSKTGTGVWIEGAAEDKAALFALLQEGEVQDVSEREYRRKRMILELLKEREVRKLFWFSSKFKVSEATISTDLETAEQWLGAYHLTVVRKPGLGISLAGQEEDYRKAIRAFVAENIDTQMIRDAYHLDAKRTEIYELFEKTGVAQLLGIDLFARVLAAIDGVQELQSMHLTEDSYISFVIHVAIAMQRILEQQRMRAEGHWLEKFVDDPDYLFAERIAAELAEEFEVEIPDLEITYICLHLKGAKHAKIALTLSQNSYIRDKSLKSLINDMIYAFDAEQAYLLKQDDDFLQGLLAHLQPTVVRLSNDMKIENPILADIKREYAALFEKCKAVGYVLEEWVAKPVPETEIGFLTVHFGAALVRLEAKRESRRVVQVGIVCSSGIGVSRLMASKLTQVFRDGIAITAYATRDIIPDIAEKEDFLIASMPLQAEAIPVVKVTALLNSADIENVRLQIKRHEYTKAKKAVNENARLGFGVVQGLTDKIKGVTQQFTLRTLPEEIDFDAAVQTVSSFIARGGMEQDEIARVLLAREKLSTQIFSEFGFALLHAKTDAVQEPRFCAFTTEECTSFTDASLGAIRIIFVMLIPAQEIGNLNAELLGFISASIVEDDDLINCVLTGEQHRVQAHLANLLEGFFAQYIHAMRGQS